MFLTLVWVATFSFGQTSFQQSFGGELDDEVVDVIEVNGFYYVLGNTRSNSQGEYDVFVRKLNASGVEIDSRVYNYSKNINSKLNDGDEHATGFAWDNNAQVFVVSGYIQADDYDIGSLGIEEDLLWMMTFDQNLVVKGEIVREVEYQNSQSGITFRVGKMAVANNFYAVAIQSDLIVNNQSTDGGVVFIPKSDVANSSNNGSNYTVVNFDAGSQIDYVNSLASNGNFVYVVGTQYEHNRKINTIVARFNENGSSPIVKKVGVAANSDLAQQNIFNRIEANDLLIKDDGKLLLVGEVAPSDKNYFDAMFFAEMSADLSSISSFKVVGENLNSVGVKVAKTNSGFALLGSSHSSEYNFGLRDIYLVNLDNNLNVRWSSVLGGEKDEEPIGMVATNDGGYMIVSNTTTFTSKGRNVLITKTNSNGLTECYSNAVRQDIVSTFDPATNLEISNSQTQNSGINQFQGNSQFVQNYNIIETQLTSFDPSCVCGFNSDFDFTEPTCLGQEVTFTALFASSSSTYAWTFGDETTTADVANTSQATWTYSTEGVKIVALAIEGTGCSNYIEKALNISSVPTVTGLLIAQDTVCLSETVDLTIELEGGASFENDWLYEWTFGSGSNPSISTIRQPDLTYSLPGKKTVQVSIKEGSCVKTVSGDLVVTENPTVPFITSMNVVEDQICSNLIVAVDVAYSSANKSNWEYSWKYGAGAVTGETFESIPEQNLYYQSAGKKFVTLKVNDGLCFTKLTDSIEVVAAPTADWSANAPKCTGEDVDFINLGSKPATGATYSWVFGEGSAIANATDQNPQGIVYTTHGTKNVVLITSISNNGKTCSDTSSQEITINLTPVPSFILPDTACVGEFVTFKNTSSTNNAGVNWTYAWELGESAKPQVSSAMSPEDVVYQIGGTKTVSLKISSDHCFASQQQTIVVNDLPEVSVVEDQTICADRCLSIGSNAVVGNSYSWKMTSGSISNATSANPEVCPEHSITSYILTVTNALGCSKNDTVIITMLDPTVANAGKDVEICFGESVQIGAYLVEGQTYSWNNVLSLSDSLSSNPVAKPEVTTTYVLTTQLFGCDVVKDQVKVKVNQLPNVTATTYAKQDTVEIALGESVRLLAGGAHEYLWDNDGFLNAAGIYDPTATPNDTILFAVTGRDVHGCENTADVFVIVNTPKVWIPSGFTPNMDGDNDYFRVRTAGTLDFELVVYSRSGEQVYFSNDADKGWDGNRQGSNDELPQGAYVYHVKGELTNGELFEETGVINLIR